MKIDLLSVVSGHCISLLAVRSLVSFLAGVCFSYPRIHSYRRYRRNATQISIWKTREAPFGERSKYEKVESWEAALDLWNKFHEGGIIGPHVCSSTFTCEESGFAGASLGPTTPLSVPSRTPLSHQPPPPSSPDIPPSPSIPSTPTTPSRSRRQATQSAPSPHPRKTKRFPFTPNVAATFSPTPADPSQLINRAHSQSTSPVRSQPLSSPIQEQSQSQSRRYNWFVVWTTESSTTQIFDNMYVFFL